MGNMICFVYLSVRLFITSLYIIVKVNIKGNWEIEKLKFTVKMIEKIWGGGGHAFFPLSAYIVNRTVSQLFKESGIVNSLAR